MSEPERIRRELYQGIEIAPAEVNTDFDGLLSYAGQQVLLYIKDTRQDKDTLLNDREKSKKFHFYNCTALIRMQNEGRYDRYVVTRRDDGFFLVDSFAWKTRTHEEMEAPLPACRYCLRELDYKRYSTLPSDAQREIWNTFSIQDLFAEYATFFVNKPRYTDKTAPPPGYVKEWGQISTTYREKRGWKCEACRVNLANHRSLLHVHHKNGVTSDNSPKNLQALCVLCHSQQPLHNHMKPSAKIRSTIQGLRIRQGVT